MVGGASLSEDAPEFVFKSLPSLSASAQEFVPSWVQLATAQQSVSVFDFNNFSDFLIVPPFSLVEL